ncbi:RICIN domain-containing protein [Paenibacillus aceris]|uniref:Alpha-galactosidase n=1 Tax=Paenibacillus aceris TaxID=869555 RepID=A0ABS4HZP5_9BACL|nr:RICIN domain-containing protein [Paenibacillus aceris]MBP1963384.1 hypothetical protein [Paenibacillus aceris]
MLSKRRWFSGFLVICLLVTGFLTPVGKSFAAAAPVPQPAINTATDLFFSDLPYTTLTGSGYNGTVNKDRGSHTTTPQIPIKLASVGGVDADPCNNNCTAFTKGINLNGSTVGNKTAVQYNVNKSFARFKSLVGPDGYTYSNTNLPTQIQFQLLGDGVTLFDSGTMTTKADSTAKYQEVDVDISNVNVLTLSMTTLNATSSAGDWAMARLVLKSADQIASGITSFLITNTDVALKYPAGAGFAFSVLSSDNPAVVGLDGAIHPQLTDATANVIVKVTRTTDNTTANTVTIPITVPALTPVFVAAGITSIAAPAQNATSLALPNVQSGFTVAIKSSTNTGVLATNGTISPPPGNTAVTLVMTVTRTSDGSTADTGSISLVVPARTGGIISGSTYKMINKNSMKTIAVKNDANALANGGLVVQQEDSHSHNEEWIVSENSATPGYYKFTNALSGKVMAVQSAVLTDGGLILQWSFGSSGNDLWQIVDAGTGFYELINKKSGLVLNVPGNSTDNGTQLEQRTNSSADSMKFQLHAITAADIAAGIVSIAAPAANANYLTLPTVPAGYTVAIKSSDNTGVIATNGTIVAQSSSTTVNLVLTVTRTSDNTTADTMSLPVVVPALITSKELSDLAAGLSITAPAVNYTHLMMPTLPVGYTAAIKSSTNEGVIATSGIITPPSAATTVSLVLMVTRTSDNATAETSAIPVVVPALSPTAANGLAQKPILGWSSWSFIRKTPTEDNIKAQADFMAANLKSHGYLYINLDDFYTLDYNTVVDQYGRWVVDPAKFPSGMKALGDYIHSLGLKFGVYVTPGIPKGAVTQNTPIEGTPYHAADIADTSKTEKNYNFKGMYYIDYSKPGAQEYVNSWANLFASYGADYLKIDGVGDADIPDIQAWSQALRSTGRPIVMALSNNLNIAYASTWKQYANSWRTQGDVECYCTTLTDWSHVSGRFGSAASWAQYAGPGGWNDLDSLDVAGGSNDGLTNDEKQAYMSLWAMASAPLDSGDDLTHTDSYGLGLLTNDEVIAVDQSAVAGTQVSNSNSTQVWKKKLADGSYYIGLFNLNTAAASITANWSTLGIQGDAFIRDLWSHKELGIINTSFTASVPAHGAKLIKVTPVSTLQVTPANGAADIDAVSINFSWPAQVNADSYRLTVAEDTAFSNIAYNSTVASTSSSVTGLSNDKQYYWKLSAIQNGVENVIGVFSFTSKFSVPPAAPDGVSVSRTTAATVQLSWNSIYGAASYSVYRKTVLNGSGSYVKIASNVTGIGYTDTNAQIDDNIKYAYQITAVNGIGESQPSAETNLPDLTSSDVAGGITAIVTPAQDATSLALPSVPAGYTVTIKSTDNPGVLTTNGVIKPPFLQTTVNVVLEINRIYDNTKSVTVSIPVVVPAKNVITAYFEAESATLGGTGAATKVSNCALCSSGKKAGFIGNAAANYVLFNNVSVPAAGQYTLKIDYLTTDSRTFFISINGGTGTQLPLTGVDFNTVSTTSIKVQLNAGVNTIKFYNDSAYAPDLDRIGVGAASAASVAAEITSIAAPAEDAATLTLPAVPDGFLVAIKSSDQPSVIGVDGTIVPQSVSTKVNLVLEVTQVSDNSKAVTVSIPVVVPAKTVVSVPSVTLTGVDAINAGQSFNLTYGLSGITQNVYAQDITITYPQQQLDFVSADSLKAGFSIIQSAVTPGQIHLITANIGADHQANGTWLTLKFNAKSTQSTSASVGVSNVVIADESGIETHLNDVSHNVLVTLVDKTALSGMIADAQSKHDEADEGTLPGQHTAGSKAALQAAIDIANAVLANTGALQAEVDQAVSDLSAALQTFANSIVQHAVNDTNGDGRISIGDLAVVAAAYGKTSADADWNQFKHADVTGDGKVDIDDLAALARGILTN